MNIGIFIPSRGRAGAVRTLQAIPLCYRAQTHIVITRGELSAYREAHPGFSVLEAAPGVDTIGKKRDWIIEHAFRRNIDYVIMLDDDLVFATRRVDNTALFKANTAADNKRMFKSLIQTLKRYAHVGILDKFGANRQPPGVLFNTRMMRVLAYDVAVLRELKFKFAACDLMCDFDATLTLLRAGYANVVLSDYAQDHGSSNAKGGCSLYRTDERQAQAALKLHAAHPDFVKVVTKETKSSWGGGQRTDVQIAWKKAFASSGDAK